MYYYSNINMSVYLLVLIRILSIALDENELLKQDNCSKIVHFFKQFA